MNSSIHVQASQYSGDVDGVCGCMEIEIRHAFYMVTASCKMLNVYGVVKTHLYYRLRKMKFEKKVYRYPFSHDIS